MQRFNRADIQVFDKIGAQEGRVEFIKPALRTGPGGSFVGVTGQWQARRLLHFNTKRHSHWQHGIAPAFIHCLTVRFHTGRAFFAQLIGAPDNLRTRFGRHTIEGNIVQGLSRTLYEEVQFDDKAVTSVDWMTYPILDITETPETIDVALIDRPEIALSGGGEPSIRPVAAAIANAIFDATGVRIRRVPFSPDRVKQALS